MLPMIVLRRLNCVLEPTKDAVLAANKQLKAAKTSPNAFPKLLTKVVDRKRKQPLYNTSAYTFQKLLDDSENIAPTSSNTSTVLQTSRSGSLSADTRWCIAGRLRIRTGILMEGKWSGS